MPKIKLTLPKRVICLLDRVFQHHTGEINQAARTREAYHAYLEAKRSWLLNLEDRAIKERPDLEFAIRNRLRLQLLYDERAALRLEYLLRCAGARFDSVKSLSEISQQVEENWDDNDNEQASTELPMYREVEQQINRLKTVDNPSIGELLAVVEKTMEHVNALRLLQETMRAIDASLVKNLA